MGKRQVEDPSRVAIARNRAEKLEDQINELQNSYGLGSFRDGQVRDAVNAKRRELADVRQLLARLEANANG